MQALINGHGINETVQLIFLFDIKSLLIGMCALYQYYVVMMILLW